MTVQGQTVTIPQSGLAAIDTGTTLIGGPQAAVTNVFAQIPGSQPLTGQMQGFFAFRMCFLISEDVCICDTKTILA
jgi:cathepsin D